MLSFSRRPVPPLPERALSSTDALYKWAQPLMLRTWGQSYWKQLYFYIAFKIALGIVCSIFIVRLLRLGQFWFVRPVRIRRGIILVPKATDSVIFFGACFILVDAAYRFRSVQWFHGPNHMLIKRYALLEGLRLAPAWLTAWVHLCASGLVWPLQLDRLRPALWHAGFFGVPVLFFATYVPAIFLTNLCVRRAQAVYLLLERELLAEAGAPLTHSMENRALQLHQDWAEAVRLSTVWAGVGGMWVGLVLIGELIVGTTLLLRVKRAYTQLPRDTTHHATATLEHSSAEAPRSSRPEGRSQTPKISVLRMIKYFAGIAPLASAPQSLQPLPAATTRRILRNFFFHSLTELVSLCGLLALFFVDIVYYVTRAYDDVLSDTFDQRFGNSFMRLMYVFHTVEMFAVAFLGSTLVISLLKRSAFPSRIGRSESRSFSESPRGDRVTYVDEEAQGDDSDEAMRSSGSKLPHRRILGMNASTASDLPLTERINSPRPAHFTSPSQELSPSTPASPLPSAASVMEQEDPCWWAGYNSGRSIVLQALVSSTDVRQVRKAAWRTHSPDSSNQNNDVDSLAASQHRYATPHGPIGPASPSRSLSVLPVEPSLRHKASTSNASSIYS